MLLGIPFHAALAYAGGRWLVEADAHDTVLRVLVPLLNDFRMPGFFLIAGFFAALLIERRRPGPWLASRAERLGLPFAAGLALLVPLQSAILRAAVSPQVPGPRSPADAVLSHLWFLPVLFALCALLALAWPRLRRLTVPDVPLWVLGVPLVAYELAMRWIEGRVGEWLRPLGGLLEFDLVLVYAPFFLLGVAACRSEALRARLTRFDPLVTATGIAALALHLALWNVEAHWLVVADAAADALSSLFVVQSLLALFARIFARPSANVTRLVDASFTIYLLHHPIVVAGAVLMLGVDLPPLFEWALICGGAFALSYAAHRVIARSQLALWLFNGMRPRRRGVIVAAGMQQRA